MNFQEMIKQSQESLEKAWQEKLLDPKFMPIKVSPKHWWGWLNPWFWKRKRILELAIKQAYPEIEKQVQEEMMDKLLSGVNNNS